VAPRGAAIAAGGSFDAFARSECMVPSYATRLFRLTLLAPDIVSAILSGKQPPELTARRLMDDTRLPPPRTDVARCPLFGRYRGESRHITDIIE
jgi:hypothetical protein